MPKKVTPKGKGAKAPNPARSAAAKKAAATRAANKAQAEATTPERKPKSERIYIRAAYNPAGGTRFNLLDGTRIFLEPRGEPGDTIPMPEDAPEDPNFIRNYQVGLFEILSHDEAIAVLTGQNTNAAQSRRPRTIDLITDEYGNPVNQQVRMEIPFEQQGQVVGQVAEAPEGARSANVGQIARTGIQPAQVSPVGSVGNPGPQVPAHVPPEQAADWLARGRPANDGTVNATGVRSEVAGISAAEQLRNSLAVRIAPVQRDITPQ